MSTFLGRVKFDCRSFEGWQQEVVHYILDVGQKINGEKNSAMRFI